MQWKQRRGKIIQRGACLGGNFLIVILSRCGAWGEFFKNDIYWIQCDAEKSVAGEINSAGIKIYTLHGTSKG